MDGDRGRFFLVFVLVFFFVLFSFLFWSFRLYLGASLCTYFLAHGVFVLMSLFFISCI